MFAESHLTIQSPTGRWGAVAWVSGDGGDIMSVEYLVPFGEGGGRVRSNFVHYTCDGGQTTVCGLTKKDLEDEWRNTLSLAPTVQQWKIYEYSLYHVPTGVCPKCEARWEAIRGWRSSRAMYMESVVMIQELAYYRDEWFSQSEETQDQLREKLAMVQTLLNKAKYVTVELKKWINELDNSPS